MALLAAPSIFKAAGLNRVLLVIESVPRLDVKRLTWRSRVFEATGLDTQHKQLLDFVRRHHLWLYRVLTLPVHYQGFSTRVNGLVRPYLYSLKTP